MHGFATNPAPALARALRCAIVLAGLAAPLAGGAALAQAQTPPDAEPERPPLSETLPGTFWNLVMLGGEPVVGEATLVFAADGQSIGGRACNSYGGDLAFSADGTPSIGAVFSTMMACEEPRLAEERALFDALEAMTGVRLFNGELILVDDGGTALAVFSADVEAEEAAAAEAEGDAAGDADAEESDAPAR